MLLERIQPKYLHHKYIKFDIKTCIAGVVIQSLIDDKWFENCFNTTR